MSGAAAIVTGSDATLFPLLEGLVHSLKRHSYTAGLPICFFDLDSGSWSAEQREWLGRHMAVIREPGWDYRAEEQADLPPWIRGLAVRPHVPRYFPEFDRFLFLDADTWIQDPRAVERYFVECDGGALVAATELDPGYDVRPRLSEDAVWRWQSRHFRKFISRRAAQIMRRRIPPFNCGAFAMRADAPHWALWAEGIDEAAKRAQGFGIDQVVLTWVTHRRRLPLTLLPARYNWCCHRALPIWDATGVLPHSW